jgi:hypothetical protein
MAERAGAEAEAFGRLAASLEDPPALLEYPDDVGPLGVLERVGGARARAGLAVPEAEGRRVDL